MSDTHDTPLSATELAEIAAKLEKLSEIPFGPAVQLLTNAAPRLLAMVRARDEEIEQLRADVGVIRAALAEATSESAINRLPWSEVARSYAVRRSARASYEALARIAPAPPGEEPPAL